jgi:hypothetical protein
MTYNTHNTPKSRRGLTLAFAIAGSMALQISQAAAVSPAVKLACISDYFAYCSAYEVGSQQLRQCMRANGTNLSKRCVNALVAAGEVSQAEVSRRTADASK